MKKMLSLLILLFGCAILIWAAIDAGSVRHNREINPKYGMELKSYDSVWTKAFNHTKSASKDLAAEIEKR